MTKVRKVERTERGEMSVGSKANAKDAIHIEKVFQKGVTRMILKSFDNLSGENMG